VGDAIDLKNVEFSEERLFALAQQPYASGSELLDKIQSELHAHIGDAEQFDDITLLAARRS